MLSFGFKTKKGGACFGHVCLCVQDNPTAEGGGGGGGGEREGAAEEGGEKGEEREGGREGGRGKTGGNRIYSSHGGI